MAFTDQQIADYAYKLEAKGAQPQEIETFIKAAKQEQTVGKVGSAVTQGVAALAPQNLGKTASTLIQEGGKLAQEAGIKIESPPITEPPKPKNFGEEFAERLNPFSEKGFVKQALMPAAETIAESTVKPIAKAGLTASVGPLIAAGKKAVSGGSIEEPVDVPGIGNINPAANTGAQNLGVAVEGLAGGANTAMLGAAAPTSVVKGALQGAASNMGLQLGKDLQEGQDLGQSLWNVGTAGLVGGAFGGAGTGLSKWLGGLSKTAKQKAEEQLFKGSLGKVGREEYANAISHLDDAQKQVALNYLDVAKQKLNDPINSPNVFDVAGREVDDWVGRAKGVEKQLGAKLGEAKTKLANAEADVMPIFDSMKKVFQDANVKLNDDLTLNLSKSELKNAGPAAAQIEEVWNSLRQAVIDSNPPTDKPLIGSLQGTMNARDLEAITGQIDNITGLLKSSGYQKSAANTMLSKLKNAINDQLRLADPEFGAINQAYASFTNDLKKINNAATVKTAGGEVIKNGAGLLRRSLGNADKKYVGAIKAMEEIGQKYGIAVPRDMQTKAYLANLAERVSQAFQPQSLPGGVAAANMATGGKAGVAMDVFKLIKNKVAPGRDLNKQLESLQKVLTLPAPKTGKITLSKQSADQLAKIVSLLGRAFAKQGSDYLLDESN